MLYYYSLQRGSEVAFGGVIISDEMHNVIKTIESF